MNMDQQLGILAKFWQPGRVMTRLAATIGQDEAAALQRAFLQTLLVRLSSVGDRRVVAFTPTGREAWFRQLAATAGALQRWHFEPQGPGDLGARLAHCFDRAFCRGAHRVALLGADSPNLPRWLVTRAFQLLHQTDVVLGPTADGGYYLVAARAKTPPIFSGMPWGSRNVLAATIRHLQTIGYPFQVLEPWYDVDRFDDLVRLRDDLTDMPARDDPLTRLAAAVRAAIDRADR